MQNVLFLMSPPNAWRRLSFAEKRPAASSSPCAGPVSHMASLSSGRFSNAQYPLRSGLWHPLNVSLPQGPLRAGASSMDLARPAAPSSYKPASTGASTAARAATLVVKRAAKATGRLPCWSSRLGLSPAAPNCPAAVWTARGSRALRGCGRRAGGAARSRNARASSKGSPDFSLRRAEHIS